MRNLIRHLLVSVGLIRRPDLIGRQMQEHPTPEQLKEGVLVVVKDKDIEKWACFRCPGGCGEKVMLSLSPRRRPKWTTILDWLRRPTLSPSVRQVNTCRCHFWIKDGAVEWCSDSGHMNKPIQKKYPSS